MAHGSMACVCVQQGEGAWHNGGCSVGGCDSFGSSLYYLDALSRLCELGHFAFFRQSLLGGNYVRTIHSRRNSADTLAECRDPSDS